MILHSRFSNNSDSYLILVNTSFICFFVIRKYVIDRRKWEFLWCLLILEQFGKYIKKLIQSCVYCQGISHHVKMWDTPTKGYNYYSVRLKIVHYMSIFWEPSFKKKQKHFNRHESRSAENSRFLRGSSVIHAFDVRFMHVFKDTKLCTRGQEVIYEMGKFCILTW